jgi:hypothetical protein
MLILQILKMCRNAKIPQETTFSVFRSGMQHVSTFCIQVATTPILTLHGREKSIYFACHFGEVIRGIWKPKKYQIFLDLRIMEIIVEFVEIFHF